MASARVATSAPAASHTSAIALMKEIFVARKAFAATLTSSAVGRSVTTTGVPAAIGWRRPRRSSASAPRSDGDAEDEPVRAQGVVDGVALAQELRVPRHLEVGGESGQQLGEAGGGADRARSTCPRSAPGRQDARPATATAATT